MSSLRIPPSEAEHYFRRDPEAERFYEIFFKLCRKYGVSWASADEKEKQFIEEVTRVTYERDRAIRLGLPLEDVRPAFVS
jgi:hypothetical protein